MDLFKGSWKTSLSGILMAICVVLGALAAVLKGDVSKIDATAVFNALALLAAAFGFVQARDNDKRSEDVGASK